MNSKIVVIDYGMGNLHSIIGSLNYLEASVQISKNPYIVKQADTLILPGVGSFGKAMERLDDYGLSDAIREAVLIRKKKILGICLGQQLMTDFSEEDGGRKGLQLISGKVTRFSKNSGIKIPHIGFNQVNFSKKSLLFKSFEKIADFYFVHSYKIESISNLGLSALCNYSGNFVAAYEYENLFATQFHPEKSQTNGLRLLYNFLKA